MTYYFRPLYGPGVDSASTGNEYQVYFLGVKLTEWEPYSSRPVGRPRLRWLDQVEEDLKKMKVRNWREKCKDRRLWKKIVKQAKTYQGL